MKPVAGGGGTTGVAAGKAEKGKEKEKGGGEGTGGELNDSQKRTPKTTSPLLVELEHAHIREASTAAEARACLRGMYPSHQTIAKLVKEQAKARTPKGKETKSCFGEMSQPGTPNLSPRFHFGVAPCMNADDVLVQFREEWEYMTNASFTNKEYTRALKRMRGTFLHTRSSCRHNDLWLFC